MKARAGLLMLLIMFISFTGFSTTTDLNQDSNAVTINSDNIEVDNVAAIVVKSDLKVNELESQEIDYSLHIESKVDLSYNIQNLSNKKVIHLLWQKNSNFNIKTSPKLKSKSFVLNYKLSRNNISC